MQERAAVGVQYRVTKYDPRFRDPSGAYTRDEWTSVNDIGRAFGGVTLTAEEYERVETAYALTVVAMLAEAGVEHLTVNGLEERGAARVPFGEDATVPVARVTEVVRGVLREDYWCRLETQNAFVHFGYDYYMYVGVPEVPSHALVQAREEGLFVEEFESPYLPRDEGSA